MALRQRPLTLCVHYLGSLAGNEICGLNEKGRGSFNSEGSSALCEALKISTTLTFLKYARELKSLPTVNSL